MNDIVESTAPVTEPGPDDLRWAEEMFEEWQRLLADIRPAVAAAHPADPAGAAGDSAHTD